jgi:hypothetical protein
MYATLLGIPLCSSGSSGKPADILGIPLQSREILRVPIESPKSLIASRGFSQAQGMNLRTIYIITVHHYCTSLLYIITLT